MRVNLLYAGFKTCFGFGWDPQHPKCWDPIAKRISNPDIAPSYFDLIMCDCDTCERLFFPAVVVLLILVPASPWSGLYYLFHSVRLFPMFGFTMADFGFTIVRLFTIRNILPELCAEEHTWAVGNGWDQPLNNETVAHQVALPRLIGTVHNAQR